MSLSNLHRKHLLYLISYKPRICTRLPKAFRYKDLISLSPGPSVVRRRSVYLRHRPGKFVLRPGPGPSAVLPCSSTVLRKASHGPEQDLPSQVVRDVSPRPTSPSSPNGPGHPRVPGKTRKLPFPGFRCGAPARWRPAPAVAIFQDLQLGTFPSEALPRREASLPEFLPFGTCSSRLPFPCAGTPSPARWRGSVCLQAFPVRGPD